MAARQPAVKVLGRLRKICLALPEAEEIETWGHPTFRVRKKIFVGCGAGDDGVAQMTCKAPPGEQRALVASDPERFFVPAYVGYRGWIGVRLDVDVDWGEIDGVVRDAFCMVAPKTVVAALRGSR